jgi:DTW domain-containing protein YfiP
MSQSQATNITTSTNHQRKRKRDICNLCERPKPETCICSALPDEPLTLSKSRVIVLQHPHEQRRKNRSLPIVELCFSRHDKDDENNRESFGCGDFPRGKSQTEGTRNYNDNHDDKKNGNLIHPSSSSIADTDFHCIVAKRLGSQTDPNLMNLIKDPNQHFLLIYPSNDAIPLNEALELIKQNEKDFMCDVKKEFGECNDLNNVNDDEINKNTGKKITLFFIDATWKYAKEMMRACSNHGIWPPHMRQVKLVKHNMSFAFQPRRFDIRTPPSEEHLSTAECIAQVLRFVEGRDEIFTTLMKPLDLMVKQWHSFMVKKRKSTKLKKMEDRNEISK